MNARCNAIAPLMAQQELAYNQLASAGQLDQWPAHPLGKDQELALGQVTRGELKGLYTDHLARSGKVARNFYDQIRVSAPNNICPYCGIGAVETIDHFLPKSRYSSLSILPSNLVPACRDCNTGKGAPVITATTTHAHPYFEDACVFQDEWLFATIVSSQVIHVVFHVVTPVLWPIATSKRVVNHFVEFKLSKRFSIQAAERLSYYSEMISSMIDGGADDSVSTFLQINARSEQTANGLNSWQAALAKAVAKDIWFQTAGYAQRP